MRICSRQKRTDVRPLMPLCYAYTHAGTHSDPEAGVATPRPLVRQWCRHRDVQTLTHEAKPIQGTTEPLMDICEQINQRARENYKRIMTNHDNWKSTTPQDEENDRTDREDAAKARIERQIDSKDWINPARIIGQSPIDFEYDPMNP